MVVPSLRNRGFVQQAILRELAKKYPGGATMDEILDRVYTYNNLPKKPQANFRRVLFGLKKVLKTTNLIIYSIHQTESHPAVYFLRYKT